MRIVDIEYGHRIEILFDNPINDIEPINHVITELLNYHLRDVECSNFEIDWRDDHTLWVWITYE